MHNQELLTGRQQWLRFPNDNLWEQLPEETQQRCRELLLQLLRTVVKGAEQERSEHERED